MNIEELKMIGWTKWEGGECPDHIRGKLCRIKRRNGSEHTTNKPEKEYNWNHHLRDEIDIIAYQLLEVGKCQNGDPVIVGGVYELDNGEIVKISERNYCYDIHRFGCLQLEQLKCIHHPKEEPLQKVRQFIISAGLCSSNDSINCAAKEALEELDNYLAKKEK